MIFDRYRNKPKTRSDELVITATTTSSKKSSLANTLFRKFPIHLSSKKKLLKKQQSDIIMHQPRPSLSLPNITASLSIEKKKEKPPMIIKQKIVSSKQRKRHSAEQRRSRRHNHLKEDVARHSYTFGHFSNKSVTRADLSFDAEQLEKLAKLVKLQDNTEFLLSKLGSQPAPVLVPHRSVSHQHLTLNTPVTNNLLFQQNLSRAHSDSHATQVIEIVNESIEPEELHELLINKPEELILVDVRNLIEYQKSRINSSLNVNLPSLLIKRYQRGTVSNFNLENFITTVEGRELFKLKNPTLNKSGTILQQKAAEQEIKQQKNNMIWIVYDEEMNTNDFTSQAWTLLNVLKLCIINNEGGKIYYLNGGYSSYEEQYPDFVEESSTATTSVSNNHSNHANINNNQHNTTFNIPRRSISYTIGDSKSDLHKRTSLFTLDTQAARVNNANALARRAKRRSEQPFNTNTLVIPNHTISTKSIEPSISSNLTLDTLPLANSHLLRVAEDDEIAGLMTADASPRTETDFGFIISEIIPGFLFVGPEIETIDHANQLDVRHIKRVLNMAEECLDQGLNEQETSVIYHKISARDTLEMKNVELVMMEAVQFIEEAKENHEPIYVHCKAGKSRSITAILAYLVTSERWTLKRAYRHVIKARPNMSPNIGFISELMKMEGRVHGRVSSFLETDWQSTSLPSPEYANEMFQLEKAWQSQQTT